MFEIVSARWALSVSTSGISLIRFLILATAQPTSLEKTRKLQTKAAASGAAGGGKGGFALKSAPPV